MGQNSKQNVFAAPLKLVYSVLDKQLISVECIEWASVSMYCVDASCVLGGYN